MELNNKKNVYQIITNLAKLSDNDLLIFLLFFFLQQKKIIFTAQLVVEVRIMDK